MRGDVRWLGGDARADRPLPMVVILNGFLGHRLEYNDAATRDLR
jgi:hypothetical protein